MQRALKASIGLALVTLVTSAYATVCYKSGIEYICARPGTAQWWTIPCDASYTMGWMSAQSEAHAIPAMVATEKGTWHSRQIASCPTWWLGTDCHGQQYWAYGITTYYQSTGWSDCPVN